MESGHDFFWKWNRAVKALYRPDGTSIILRFAKGEAWGLRQLSGESHFDSDADLQRYEALLEMADLVVHHHSLPELFAAMAGRLRHVAAADAAHFAIYDPIKKVMRGHFWEKSALSAAAMERPVDDSPSGWAWQNQQSLVIPDLAADSRFSPVLAMLREKGLRSYCWLPLTTAEKRLGMNWSWHVRPRASWRACCFRGVAKTSETVQAGRFESGQV